MTGRDHKPGSGRAPIKPFGTPRTACQFVQRRVPMCIHCPQSSPHHFPGSQEPLLPLGGRRQARGCMTFMHVMRDASCLCSCVSCVMRHACVHGTIHQKVWHP